LARRGGRENKKTRGEDSLKSREHKKGVRSDEARNGSEKKRLKPMAEREGGVMKEEEKGGTGKWTGHQGKKSGNSGIKKTKEEVLGERRRTGEADSLYGKRRAGSRGKGRRQR